MEQGNFSCDTCGGSFDSREELIQHNVDQHNMSEEESRQAVMRKYPMQR